MAILDTEQHRVILAALGLMNGGGVGEIQMAQTFIVLIGHNAVIMEIHLHQEPVIIPFNFADIADVSVADLFPVLGLHDLVTKPEDPLPQGQLRFICARWIDQGPQPLIHASHAGLGLCTERSQQRNIVHAIPANLLHIQPLQPFGGLLNIGGPPELEVSVKLEVRIAMTDVPGVLGDHAAFALAKHLVQHHHRDSAAAQQLTEYRARPYRRKLVSISHQYQPAHGWQRME